MKTPWINYKRMQEIIPTQKNCIKSSDFHIESLFQERNFRQIKITNSSGIQIKAITSCFKWKNTEHSVNKNGQLAQNDYFHESLANTDANQRTQDDRAVDTQHDDKITVSTNVQIRSVHDVGSGSSFDPTQGPTNTSVSTILGESYTTFNHQVMNEKDVPDDTEAFHMNRENRNESSQVAQNDHVYELPANTDADYQNDDTKTDSTDVRINPVHDASSESSNDLALYTTDSSEFNISDESHKTFDYEEMNENGVPDDTDKFRINRNKSDQLAQNDHVYESPAYMDADPFTQDGQDADYQNDDTITDSNDVRINPVHDASSESSIDLALYTTDSSEFNISDESYKTFDYEEMNENDVPDDTDKFRINRNKSDQLAQNDHVYESPAYMDADPFTQDGQDTDYQNDDTITDSTDVRINPVHDASSESSIDLALYTTDSSEFNISDESYKTFDYEEMNENDVPDDTDKFRINRNKSDQLAQNDHVYESPAYMDADSFTQDGQDADNQNDDTITDSTDLRINPVHDASSESSIDLALYITDSSEFNISDESYEAFDHEEMNEKDVPDDTDEFHMNGKNRNKSGQLAQNDYFYESSAYTDADPFTQDGQDADNQNDDTITDSTDLRINPVHDASSESSIDLALYITDSSDVRINPVHDASSESSIDLALYITDSSEFNISDESYKTFDHEEMNENDVPDDTDEFHINRNKSDQLAQKDHVYESSAYTDADPFTQDDRDATNQNDDTITNPADVRISSVHDTSSESSTDPALDPTNSSESNISDESHKTFNHEEMNENIHDSFKSGEINHNSVPTLHFINIRVPVVVGEYKLEFCLEEVVTFEEKVRKIKEISNKVVLTNCKFVPTQLSQVLDNGTCKALEGYLFIEGSIHQSIEYVLDGTDEFPMNGKLCFMKRNSPFSITVKIDDFLHPPIFGSIAQTTFEFLDQNNTQIPQLDTKLFHSTIYYPEQPYCQIISSEIHQSVCLANTMYASNNHLNQSVVVPKKYQLDQKIVVEVFVHLLQIQHVRVKSDDK